MWNIRPCLKSLICEWSIGLQAWNIFSVNWLSIISSEHIRITDFDVFQEEPSLHLVKPRCSVCIWDFSPERERERERMKNLKLLVKETICGCSFGRSGEAYAWRTSEMHHRLGSFELGISEVSQGTWLPSPPPNLRPLDWLDVQLINVGI
jgi:hypothetical protein